MRELHISRQDLREARVVNVDPLPLGDGAARLQLDLFALTSNNITYAAMGEGALGYWDFFPGPQGWGRPPCWGFATVVQSTAPGVEEGARFYGYFPISETLDVTPANIGPRGFIDAASHRIAKMPVYNQYINTAADPAYNSAFEPEQTLFRPLYATGWWLADCVLQRRPRTVVISSASAKTALATANQLRRLSDTELVGFTSARNEGYVQDTGLYHRTLRYEAVDSLVVQAPAAYVDFLGRDALITAVHRAIGASLERSILVGATDWADKPGGIQPPKPTLAGPQPEFLLVPVYAASRLTSDRELGAAMRRDLDEFYLASRAFVSARLLHGAGAILKSWARLVAGEVSPREGLVLSF